MSLSLLFVLTCLAAYRVVRLWTVDDFPPVMWARGRLAERTARHWGAAWAEGVDCPWCVGFHISAAVVGAVWYVHPLPMPALWFGAVPAVVGIVAEKV